ncbi:ATP-dependent helicase [Nostoc sp. CHAB 5834]|nr:ATP-dependent helicase [Nostoc sp. CHAB 5834]
MVYQNLFAELESSKRSASGFEYVGPGLSKEQQSALSAPLHENAIVCAGAGAGKTKLLVERVTRLIKSGANPRRIAVVTFTRKAADELTERIERKLGKSKDLPFCGTVHSLAYKVLSRRKIPFLLATEEQEAGLVKELKPFLPDEYDELTTKELVLAIGKAREQQDKASVLGYVALAYEELLANSGLEDFSSLLTKAAVVKADLYDYVLVDESQDLGRIQLNFLKRVGPNAFFWYIGDPDQAIYGFRGASSTMMHELRDECSGFYPLTLNFRCAQTVLGHANNVIRFNPDRIPLNWTPHRTDEGDVSVKIFETGEEELEAAMRWAAISPLSRCILARTQSLISVPKIAGLIAHTVHESKGLEWPEVWLIGCEASLFPHPLAPKEEERRLFYVALTRAKDNLIMSYAESRSTRKGAGKRQPSAFLYETQAIQAKT